MNQPTEQQYPDPREFDFRQVGYDGFDELEAAIRIEYARSSKWLMAAVQQWHGQVIKGETVQKLLPRFDHLPIDVQVRIRDTFPTSGDLCMLAIRFWNFPEPYLSLDPAERRRRLDAFRRDIPKLWCPAFHKVKDPWLFRERMTGPPVDGVEFLMARIDWRQPMQKILKEVTKWIKAEYASDRLSTVRREKRRGKAGRSPWYKLKELAAHRIRFKYGYGFEKWQQFYVSYIKAHPMASADVLPNYGSSGAWYDASNSAQERIAAMYPPSSYAVPELWTGTNEPRQSPDWAGKVLL